ncbi:MAG: DNA recombination protein RmuC [Cyclobacteriaceae bacterium]|nr:DNA recombination protein RmuC [Cyclobacteriaceae bacterium]
MDILYLLTGLATGAAVAALMVYWRFKASTVSKELHNNVVQNLSDAQKDTAIERNNRLQLTTTLEKREIEILQLREKQVQLIGAESRLLSEKFALQEKIDTQVKEMTDLRKTFALEFENLANKILDEKSQKFTEQNKLQLKTILDPLNEKIADFKKKVEDVYDKEAKERFSLGNEVKKLVELNQQISKEAQNLTHALKGNSKIQGDWGQMILENILEHSGLVKDREYFVQEYLKDADGRFMVNESGQRMQPDVIIAYPDDRKLIIDAKVSLTDYVRYTETEDPDVQGQCLNAHLLSLRRHIDQLSVKSYQDFAASLDFVMMFVPNEPAYLVALQKDKSLWEYAYKKRIILISPTNLIAALKLVSELWKREYQSQNVQAIAERGAMLYDKFAGFVENLSKVGDHLHKTHQSYDDAMKQLSEGKGNLVQQAGQLRDLGIKSKKTLPSSLTDRANEGF